MQKSVDCTPPSPTCFSKDAESLKHIFACFDAVRLFIFVLILTTTRAVSAALHTPNWRAHAVTWAQKSVPSPLSSPKKPSTPKLIYEALEISKVSGPFERKVLRHYSYFWLLWKQGIHTWQLLSGAPLKAK